MWPICKSVPIVFHFDLPVDRIGFCTYANPGNWLRSLSLLWLDWSLLEMTVIQYKKTPSLWVNGIIVLGVEGNGRGRNGKVDDNNYRSAPPHFSCLSRCCYHQFFVVVLYSLVYFWFCNNIWGAPILFLLPGVHTLSSWLAGESRARELVWIVFASRSRRRSDNLFRGAISSLAVRRFTSVSSHCSLREGRLHK